jgi:tetratricopeptide (TPR) repeat protein
MLATSSGLIGPYSIPPVDMSADAQFGPLAVQRFMGVLPAGVAAQQIGGVQQIGPQQQAAGQGALQGAPPPRPNVRPSNAAARDRAWRQIELGDTEFLQREFARALEHYRSAAVAAADLGEAFFRQGHAMMALGLYEPAAKAMRRGLLFDPDWADSDFHLDDLYGDNKPVKNGKLDVLEKAAAAHLQDPALQFLAGVELFFDGQLDRAAPFLRRADTMYGPQASFLQGFLKKLPAAQAGAQNPGGNNPGGDNPAPGQKKPVAGDEGLDT